MVLSADYKGRAATGHVECAAAVIVYVSDQPTFADDNGHALNA